MASSRVEKATKNALWLGLGSTEEGRLKAKECEKGFKQARESGTDRREVSFRNVTALLSDSK